LGPTSRLPQRPAYITGIIKGHGRLCWKVSCEDPCWDDGFSKASEAGGEGGSSGSVVIRRCGFILQNGGGGSVVEWCTLCTGVCPCSNVVTACRLVGFHEDVGGLTRSKHEDFGGERFYIRSISSHHCKLVAALITLIRLVSPESTEANLCLSIYKDLQVDH
ncbi:hypothetical protein M8C21_024403, partial [Ambrosia artemisiifolia]